MKWLFFISLFFSTALSAHDFHVSVFEIERSEEIVEITFKTFLDDLQIAVGLHPGEELPESYTSAEEMIAEYIRETVSLKINGEERELVIEQFDASQEAVWISFKFTEHNLDSKSLKLESTFLTEVYNDQTNIIHVKNGKKNKKSFVLNRKKVVADYEF